MKQENCMIEKKLQDKLLKRTGILPKDTATTRRLMRRTLNPTSSFRNRSRRL